MVARVLTIDVVAPSAQPAWASSLGVNQIANVGTSKLTDSGVIDPFTASNGSLFGSTESSITASKLDSHIGGWNGISHNPLMGQHGSLLTFGGGHGDYSGNEIYRWDIATGQFSRIKNCWYRRGGSIPKVWYTDLTGGGYQCFTPISGTWVSPSTARTDGANHTGEFWANPECTESVAGEPAPGHTYGSAIWLPPGTWGNNTLGYLMLPGQHALPMAGSSTSTYIHYLNLDTLAPGGVIPSAWGGPSNDRPAWNSGYAGPFLRSGIRLVTSGKHPGVYIDDGSSKRFVTFNGGGSSSRPTNVELLTFNGTASPTYTRPALIKGPGAVADFKPYYSSAECITDGAGKKWICYFGNTDSLIFLIDPVTWTYYTPTISGVGSGAFGGNGGGCWVSDWRQILYCCWGGTGSDRTAGVGGAPRIWRLNVPSVFPGTWTWTYTDLSGSANPSYVGGSGTGYRGHWNRIRYIPLAGDASVKLFTWLAAHNTPVQGFKLAST